IPSWQRRSPRRMAPRRRGRGRGRDRRKEASRRGTAGSTCEPARRGRGWECMSLASASLSSRSRPAVASGRTRHASVAARGLLDAAERDLQQIILDIHDGPVQDIFGALSQIQMLRHRGEVQSSDALVLDRVAASLERALGEIRNFIGAFRPPEFERRPVGAILEQLVVQHESLTGATVDFTMTTPLPDQVPLSLKISLYRILQE